MMIDSYQTGDILKRYYKFHSQFYDSTRWSFLFGRKKIIKKYLDLNIKPNSVLEVGCGTGKNLDYLSRLFPESDVIGIDISSEMLKKSRKKIKSDRVSLINGFYGSETFKDQTYDLILFSYSLSMMNPGWEKAIESAYNHLKCGGHLAVVDFFDSDLQWFKTWMGVNHVRMEGHLDTEIKKYFEPVESQIKKAYLGIWDYLLFIGRKS